LSHLKSAEPFVKALVAEHPDATVVELRELFAHQTGNWVRSTAICRYLQKLGLNRKKKHGLLAKPQQKKSKN
jgi:transposase